MKIGVLSTLLFVLWGGQLSAEEGRPLWKVLEDAVLSTNYDPLETELRARAMLSRADVQTNCDSLYLVEHLLRFSSTALNTPWPPDGFAPSPACDAPPSPLIYLRAVGAYQTNRFPEAEALFREAASTAQREGVKALEYLSLQAVGATLTQISRYEEAVAVFLEAYELVPEAINLISLNNLAMAHLLAGQCAEAISWSNVAIERFELGKEGVIQHGTYNDLSKNVLLLTRLQAEQNLGDLEACRQTFREINLKGEWSGRETAAIATLTEYLQWSNDVDRFAIIRPLLDRMASEVEASELIEATGANYQLFSPWSDEGTWQAKWQELRDVPDAFRGGLGIPCNSVEKASLAVGATQRTANKQGWIVLTLCLLMVVAGTYLALLLRNAMAWQALKASSPDDMREALEGILANEAAWTWRERFLALKSVECLAEEESKTLQQTDIDPSAWTQIEQDVAARLAHGEHTKAIAQQLNVSLSAVYKARHTLRARFNLQPQESLEKRLTDFFPILLFAVFSSLPSTVESQPESATDWGLEVVKSIQTDDYTRWVNAMQELKAHDEQTLHAPFDVALLPLDERPTWAHVEDTLMWIWFKAGSVALEMGNREQPGEAAVNASPTPALQRLSHALSPSNSKLWPWLSAVVGLLLLTIAAFERRARRCNIHPELRDWSELARNISGNRREPAQEVWRIIKSRQPQTPISAGFWNLLSRPEQIVAQLTAQDWSVQDIADHLSCSTGNVYNLRSSIRQKWSMDPTDDLVRFIQSLQAEENLGT